MALDLGAQAESLLVRLHMGADFATTLEAKNGAAEVPWPTGTVIELIFATTPTPTTWAATITTNKAVWVVQSTVADLIPGGIPVSLWYRLGTTDTLWAVGTVFR